LGLPAAGSRPPLAVRKTGGGSKAGAGAHAAFGQARRRLGDLGVTRADRHSDRQIATFEQIIAEAVPVTFQIFEWELRWPLGCYAKHNGLSEGMRRRLAAGLAATLDDYRQALVRRRQIREHYGEVSAAFDGFVTLAATGAAPVGLGWTGDPVF